MPLKRLHPSQCVLFRVNIEQSIRAVDFPIASYCLLPTPSSPRNFLAVLCLRARNMSRAPETHRRLYNKSPTHMSFDMSGRKARSTLLYDTLSTLLYKLQHLHADEPFSQFF